MGLTDPTDKPLDALADGAFAGKVTSHRGGYGDGTYWALRQARKGGTLQAGEGLLLIKHYEAIVADLEDRILALSDLVSRT